MENSKELPNIIETTTILWFGNPTPGYLSKRVESGFQRDVCTPVFTAALFTIAKRWKQPKCPLTDEWIKKMWYIHVTGYYTDWKEGNSSIRDSMGEPWKHCVKLNKPVTEGQILHDSMYMK